MSVSRFGLALSLMLAACSAGSASKRAPTAEPSVAESPSPRCEERPEAGCAALLRSANESAAAFLREQWPAKHERDALLAVINEFHRTREDHCSAAKACRGCSRAAALEGYAQIHEHYGDLLLSQPCPDDLDARMCEEYTLRPAREDGPEGWALERAADAYSLARVEVGTPPSRKAAVDERLRALVQRRPSLAREPGYHPSLVCPPSKQ